MKYDYTTELKLKHNESPAKIDNETGEITTLTKRINNIPEGREIQKFKEFNKVNVKAIEFLEKLLTNEELGIVFKMINRADYETNVMIPLSDETTCRSLSKEFNIGKNKITRTFEKLFDLGVYAQVRVANGLHSEYWTLNPYIAWKGKFIERAIGVYFSNTTIAKALI
jgi:hypothetical protein